MFAASFSHFSTIRAHLASSPPAADASSPYFSPSHHSNGSSSSSSDDSNYLPSDTAGAQLWSSSSSCSDPPSSGYGAGLVLPHSERSGTTHHQYSDMSKERRASPSSRYVAVSAQWVYSGDHPKVPIIARVSITDVRGCTILDTFVRPTQPVTDYRFSETGLQDHHLYPAPHISEIQERVRAIVVNRVIVGYQLWNFLSLLQLTHPAIDTRDIASFVPFRKSLRLKRNSIVPLPLLVTKLMGRGFGEGYEHPLENARACLDLFRSSQTVWENMMQEGMWPCSTLEDVPQYAYGCFT